MISSPHVVPSGPNMRIGVPASPVVSTRPPWKYLVVYSGFVIASQICTGVALMNTW